MKASYQKASQERDADILYVNSPMAAGLEISLSGHIRNMGKSKKRNVILILVTEGGDPDVAFKISRMLQRHYDDFSIVIPGWCKSAGTLLAIGANNVYFGSLGELGPLDIQIGKKDEITGSVSGLDLQYGIMSLRKTAFQMFESYMFQMVEHTSGRVSLKMAAEIASTLTAPYINKIAEQISPVDMGDNIRSTTIAIDYGNRLNERYKNLRESQSLSRLVHGYPSHGFVIDKEEAEEIFNRVFHAPQDLSEILQDLGTQRWYPASNDGIPVLAFLNRLTDDNVHMHHPESEDESAGIPTPQAEGNADGQHAVGENSIDEGGGPGNVEGHGPSDSVGEGGHSGGESIDPNGSQDDESIT